MGCGVLSRCGAGVVALCMGEQYPMQMALRGRGPNAGMSGARKRPAVLGWGWVSRKKAGQLPATLGRSSGLLGLLKWLLYWAARWGLMLLGLTEWASGINLNGPWAQQKKIANKNKIELK